MRTLALIGIPDVRNETKEAMRLFLGGRCYTAENLERDYLAEVTGYSDDRWEARSVPHVWQQR
nr:YadA [Salmonella enterica subsp. enterica serovar Rissen]